MLLREVEYARPASIEDALALLGSNPNARALAGGQTLVNVMKARAAAPDVLVDLNGLDELREISARRRRRPRARRDGDLLVDRAVARGARARPIVAEVAGLIADVQVRNRGTVGGNVCTGDPTNHLPPLMVALGATMTVARRRRRAQVPAEEFFLGVYMTAVGPGELLTKISIPPPTAGDGFAIVTIGKDGTRIVCAAACARGTIESARVTLGCVDAVPVRSTRARVRLARATPERAAARRAGGRRRRSTRPRDVHASADYRRHSPRSSPRARS